VAPEGTNLLEIQEVAVGFDLSVVSFSAMFFTAELNHIVSFLSSLSVESRWMIIDSFYISFENVRLFLQGNTSVGCEL
jgi:hypothetical protein